MKTNIQKIDNGTCFGYLQPEARRFFVEEAGKHIESFCEELSVFEGRVRIADLGGGNGILAREIAQKMGDKVSVDILDIDTSKFPKSNAPDNKPLIKSDEPSINYIEHDVRFPVDKPYDALIARSMLHYNSREDQFRILRNIPGNIEGEDSFFTIIQPAPTGRERGKINRLYQWLAEKSNTPPKYFLTAQEILGALSADSRIRVYAHEILPAVPLTVGGFYKGRYKLSDSSAGELESLLCGKPVCLPAHIITAIKK